MRREGTGKEAIEGIYEPERLRRRARQLGLRLVKGNALSLQEEREPRNTVTEAAASHDGDEPAYRIADLDRCG